MKPVFISINGESKGPYGIDDLRMLHRHGVLNAKTEIYNEESKVWQPLDELPEIQASVLRVPEQEARELLAKLVEIQAGLSNHELPSSEREILSKEMLGILEKLPHWLGAPDVIGLNELKNIFEPTNKKALEAVNALSEEAKKSRDEQKRLQDLLVKAIEEQEGRRQLLVEMFRQSVDEAFTSKLSVQLSQAAQLNQALTALNKELETRTGSLEDGQKFLVESFHAREDSYKKTLEEFRSAWGSHAVSFSSALAGHEQNLDVQLKALTASLDQTRQKATAEFQALIDLLREAYEKRDAKEQEQVQVSLAKEKEQGETRAAFRSNLLAKLNSIEAVSNELKEAAESSNQYAEEQEAALNGKLEQWTKNIQGQLAEFAKGDAEVHKKLLEKLDQLHAANGEFKAAAELRDKQGGEKQAALNGKLEQLVNGLHANIDGLKSSEAAANKQAGEQHGAVLGKIDQVLQALNAKLEGQNQQHQAQSAALAAGFDEMRKKAAAEFAALTALLGETFEKRQASEQQRLNAQMEQDKKSAAAHTDLHKQLQEQLGKLEAANEELKKSIAATSKHSDKHQDALFKQLDGLIASLEGKLNDLKSEQQKQSRENFDNLQSALAGLQADRQKSAIALLNNQQETKAALQKIVAEQAGKPIQDEHHVLDKVSRNMDTIFARLSNHEILEQRADDAQRRVGELTGLLARQQQANKQLSRSLAVLARRLATVETRLRLKK